MGRRHFVTANEITIDTDAGVVTFTGEDSYFIIKTIPSTDGSLDVCLERGDPKRDCSVSGRAWRASINQVRIEFETSELEELRCERVFIYHELTKAELKPLKRWLKQLLPRKHFSTSKFTPTDWPDEHDPIINNGDLIAGFAVFYRTNGRLTHNGLMSELQLPQYKHGQSPNGYGRCLVITDDGQWLQLTDGYGYNLWYNSKAVANIRSLARQYDTLIVGFPDTDHSFDIEFWQGGRVRRKVSFDDNYGKPPETRYNIGQPLAAESGITLGKAPDEALWQVVESLGIKTDYETMDFEVYSDTSTGDGYKAGQVGFSHNEDGLVLLKDP